MKPTIIHCVHQSNFANYMIKYMVARKLQDRVKGSILSNYHMPYWNIDEKPIDRNDSVVVDFRFRDNEINLDRVSYLGNSGLIDRINIHGHLQRMENFPTIESCRAMFPVQGGGIEFDENYLVCPIRGGEVLDARHGGYSLLPIDFYADIFTKNPNLRPVFMGQIENNIYCDKLRFQFPGAIFIPSQGATYDFETIRKSKNLVLPISTFAWLAAWMSHATKIILPVFGLFNPEQTPDNDLIPLGDERYELYQFPVQIAVRVENFEQAHAELANAWKLVDHRDLIRTLE